MQRQERGLYRWMRAALLGVACLGGHAVAADVSLVGMFPGKALVSVDGAAPRIMAPGSTVNGVTLVSVASDSAVFTIDGRRETLRLGQFYGGKASGGRSSTTLTADERGHYITQGTINGGSVTFLVDTGATLVVLSAQDATRLGINYRSAPVFQSNTANGPVPFYRVTLDTVKVGGIVLNNVEGAVQEGGLTGMSLLGMSFLSRTDMNRDGQNMVLTKRF